MTKTKQERYNAKCKLYCLRFRKDKDKKYIEFLDKCHNRVDFIRKAIDQQLNNT